MQSSPSEQFDQSIMEINTFMSLFIHQDFPKLSDTVTKLAAFAVFASFNFTQRITNTNDLFYIPSQHV